ncbi:hypothetical protein SLA2020_389470 [Shorea laevis]
MSKIIATKWRALSGEEEWKGLLDPLDLDLRRYIIHYGERVQAIYDAFIGDEKSKNCGLPRYAKRHLFSKVGLEKGNPYKYEVTKYFYATTDISSTSGFIKKSRAADPPAGDSNWIGFQILGEKHDPKVHNGWYSMYTTAHEGSAYNSTSCRDQVLSEVKRLVNNYKKEEVSITVTGHSLGAALATLNAVDIVYNGHNIIPQIGNLIYPPPPIKICPVTVFAFGAPRVGDKGFHKLFFDLKKLHVLRVNNKPGDIIPSTPPSVQGVLPYVDVGDELIIDTIKSPYLKQPNNVFDAHNLEVYLHGVAGTHGKDGEFKLEVNRQIALVNKTSDFVKDELLVLDYWWTTNKESMAQNDDGSWVLMDHESDD